MVSSNSNIPTFISDFSYLYPLFFFLSQCKLKVCQIVVLFKQPNFGFINSIMFYSILFISLGIIIITFLLLSLALVCSYFLVSYYTKLGY